MRVNENATRRLEMASRGELIKEETLDPALRIPRSRLRMDAWENQTTGFGTPGQHPANNSGYVDVGKLNAQQLEGMYRSDWVTRKGVDAPAEDMTRNGITFKHNDDDLTEEGTPDKDKSQEHQKKTEDFENVLVSQFNWWQRAFEALALSSMSGGSLTLFAFDDINAPGEFRDPLNENAVSDIRWVRTFPAHLCIPLTYYRDINHPKWGEPEHYQVVVRNVGGGITLNVHESRVIRVDGRYTTQQNKVINRGWNDSDIQAVYTALRDYGVCVTAATSTMESFTQDYLGMAGLAEKVMVDGGMDSILDRIYLSHTKMTSNTLSLYDSESEKMERQGTPVTGLSDLWDRHTEAVCGSFGIPRNRFLTSESGSLGGNASDTDMRIYYSGVSSKQELKLRPYLNDFMKFVNMATGMIEEIPDYEFNELQEQSDKEKAETRFIQSQTDVNYEGVNAISGEEIAISRWSKSTPDLESVIIDFEARAEMGGEISQEEAGEMQNTIANIEMENAVNEAAAKQVQPQVIQPAEKQDSNQTILVRPEITVEAPIINIPEQKDYSVVYMAKLDEITKKLDEDHELIIDD